MVEINDDDSRTLHINIVVPDALLNETRDRLEKFILYQCSKYVSRELDKIYGTGIRN